MRPGGPQDANSLRFSELLQSTSPSEWGTDSLNCTSRTRYYNIPDFKLDKFLRDFSVSVSPADDEGLDIARGAGEKRKRRRMCLMPRDTSPTLGILREINYL